MEEDSHLGALQQYVHLNPVRAGMCDVEGLKDYRWSSYWYLQHPELRSKFLDPSGALRAAWSVAACKTVAEIAHERKSVVWKIWIASELKRKTSAPSTWIAHQLSMASPQLVGRYLSGFHQAILDNPSGEYDRFIYKYTE